MYSKQRLKRICLRQDSVTNYDIFEYDDFVDTQEVDPTLDYNDNGCNQCGNVVTADPFLRWHPKP